MYIYIHVHPMSLQASLILSLCQTGGFMVVGVANSTVSELNLLEAAETKGLF